MSDIDAVLDAIEDEFDLEPIEGDRLLGKHKGHVFTFRFLGAEPLSLLLGFRVKSKANTKLKKPSLLREAIEQEEVALSLENGYVWLSIYNPKHVCSLSVFKGIVDAVIRAIEATGIAKTIACQCCGSAESKIVNNGSDLHCFCPDCFKSVMAKPPKADEDLSQKSLPLFTIAVISGILTWSIVWTITDKLIAATGRPSVELPKIVILFIGAVLGAIVASPGVGLTRLSGYHKHYSPPFLTAIFMIAVALLGEATYQAGITNALTHPSWVLEVAGHLPRLVQTYGEGNAMARVVGLIGAATFFYSGVATPKKVKKLDVPPFM